MMEFRFAKTHRNLNAIIANICENRLKRNPEGPKKMSVLCRGVSGLNKRDDFRTFEYPYRQRHANFDILSFGFDVSASTRRTVNATDKTTTTKKKRIKRIILKKNEITHFSNTAAESTRKSKRGGRQPCNDKNASDGGGHGRS
ncbi:Hypothetical protein CINCED_3A004219 [Cinara cedri]|uniref:Uncharacterized protein n=1 Tax=Cinara cedri TaxID=506608 RepID=A0A5E4NL44_9HEMI|nr:Hypothetical protein CINCED_3A004219 [Cinara cedri]